MAPDEAFGDPAVADDLRDLTAEERRTVGVPAWTALWPMTCAK